MVRPVIQLLYMATSSEAKNQHDFTVARPNVDDDAANWLADALATTISGHRLIPELDA